MKCNSCKFWDQDKEYISTGFSHRHAPQSLVSQPQEAVLAIDVTWPRTRETDWCGKWSAKVDIEEGR